MHGIMAEYLQFCTAEQREKVHAEFRTTEELLRRDARHLITWLETHPYLPNVKDETFLANVLLSCRNSIERAKTQLEIYYVGRATSPETCSNYNVSFEYLEKNTKFLTLIPLPKLTPAGYRIRVLCSFGHFKDTMDPNDILKVMLMTLSVCTYKDTVAGCIIIFDFKNMNVTDGSVALANVKKYVHLSSTINPTRFARFYVLNLSPVAQQVFNFTLTTVKRKLIDRVVIWRKAREDLAEVLPRHVLPSDYGGEEQSMAELRALWIEYMTSQGQWFASQQTMKADLSLMPGKCETSNNVSGFFGADGSFRSISID